MIVARSWPTLVGGTPLMSSNERTLAQLLVRGLAILTVAFGVIGCATGTAPPPTTQPVTADFADEYRIGVGDTLTISVWRNDDLSVTGPTRRQDQHAFGWRRRCWKQNT